MTSPVTPTPATSATPTLADPVPDAVETLDPKSGYKLHPKVALRPEPFGALAYHYGNRKLVFLKSPRMVVLVRDLGSFTTLDAALTAAGLTHRSRPKYLAALNSLALSDMLIPV
jgi:putative mycofactocin binding protein MftB